MTEYLCQDAPVTLERHIMRSFSERSCSAQFSPAEARSRRRDLLKMGLGVLTLLMLFSAKSTPSQAADDSAKKAAMGALELARHYYKKGEYDKAVSLFHQAYSLDPIPDLLFNAARAEQRSFRFKEAERDFQAFLKLKSSNKRANQRAQVHLREIHEAQTHIVGVRAQEDARMRQLLDKKSLNKNEKTHNETKKTHNGTKKTRRQDHEPPEGASFATNKAQANKAGQGLTGLHKSAPAPTASSWQRPLGWISLGIGAGGLITGATLWGLGAADQKELETLATDRDKNDMIDKISWEKYEERRLANSRKRRWGAVALGAGSVLAAIGGWWLWSDRGDPRTTRVEVGPDSVRLALKF